MLFGNAYILGFYLSLRQFGDDIYLRQIALKASCNPTVVP